MKKNLYSEKEIKEAFNINSFRNLSKDKIEEFVSLIPNMDKDVAIKAINQFPAFVEMSSECLKVLFNTCDKIIESNREVELEAINTYKLILNALEIEIHKDYLSLEDKLKISQQMVEIADKVNQINNDSKKFKLEVLKYVGLTIGSLTAFGVTILGIKVSSHKLPTIAKEKFS